MPYDYDPNLDPNSQQNQNPGGAQQITGASSVVSAAPAAGNVSGGGASSTGGAGQSQAPTHSGSYQNLQNYLNANDANAFGQQFAGKVNADINQATGAQQQAAQNFKAQSDAGTTTPNASLVNQAISDPYNFVQNPSNLTGWQQQLNASYKGPQSFADDQADYQRAQSATQKATDTGNATQTEGGRFALLNQYFGNPNYTQGQMSLDNLLVSGAGDNTQQALQQAQQNAARAQTNFANEQQDLSNYAAQNIGQAQAAQNQARAAIGIDQAGNLLPTNPIQSVVSADQQKAAQLQAQQLADYNAAVAGLGKNTLTAAQMQKLGLTPNMALWGVNPSAFINNLNVPTASSVQSLSDAQKIAALSQLAGVPNNFLDATQAGTYNPTQDLTYNVSALNAAIAKNQADARTAAAIALNPLLDQANQQEAFWYNFNNGGGAVPLASRDTAAYLAPYSGYLQGLGTGGNYSPMEYAGAFQQIINNIEAARAAAAANAQSNTFLKQSG